MPNRVCQLAYFPLPRKKGIRLNLVLASFTILAEKASHTASNSRHRPFHPVPAPSPPAPRPLPLNPLLDAGGPLWQSAFSNFEYLTPAARPLRPARRSLPHLRGAPSAVTVTAGRCAWGCSRRCLCAGGRGAGGVRSALTQDVRALPCAPVLYRQRDTSQTRVRGRRSFRKGGAGR